MTIDSQDRELTAQMRNILAYAKQQLPESIICIFSFTQAEDGSPIGLNKVATNAGHREAMASNIVQILDSMLQAEIVDLTDVQGGMQ